MGLPQGLIPNAENLFEFLGLNGRRRAPTFTLPLFRVSLDGSDSDPTKDATAFVQLDADPFNRSIFDEGIVLENNCDLGEGTTPGISLHQKGRGAISIFAEDGRVGISGQGSIPSTPDDDVVLYAVGADPGAGAAIYLLSGKPIVLGDGTGTHGAGNGTPLEFTEQSDADAPADDKARLYLRDNGAGKTQLVCRFNTGAIQVIATQP
jgi:hypothetical protein